jgi:hypothetical protein
MDHYAANKSFFSNPLCTICIAPGSKLRASANAWAGVPESQVSKSASSEMSAGMRSLMLSVRAFGAVVMKLRDFIQRFGSGLRDCTWAEFKGAYVQPGGIAVCSIFNSVSDAPRIRIMLTTIQGVIGSLNNKAAKTIA